jgi:hypothetical protein
METNWQSVTWRQERRLRQPREGRWAWRIGVSRLTRDIAHVGGAGVGGRVVSKSARVGVRVAGSGAPRHGAMWQRPHGPDVRVRMLQRTAGAGGCHD